MDAVDESIPDPVRDKDKPFLMPIEDVFTAPGLGTIATGRIERGSLEVGATVEIIGSRSIKSAVVRGIEMFGESWDEVEAGESAGLILSGIDFDSLERGQVIAAPGTVRAHAEFDARAYFLSEQEGGRGDPLFADFRAQFYFHTIDVTGFATLPEGTDMVHLGGTADMTVELNQPIAMEEGLGFAIRMRGRTVGMGTVTRLGPPPSVRSVPPREVSVSLPPQPSKALTAGMFSTDVFENSQPDSSLYAVWFGTNRKPSIGKGEPLGFSNSIDSGPVHYGRCTVNVPRGHRFGSVGTPLWKSWWQLGKRDEPLTIRQIDSFGSDEAFSLELRRALSVEDAENRALVYLHGYNTTFEQAAIRAAQIGFDLKVDGAMAFFSWPSHADVDAYPADTQRAGASEASFIEFLRVLKERSGVERVDLLVHSMGNQVFARSVQQILYASEKVEELSLGTVILAAPDIDVHLFRQIAPLYGRAASKTTMYVSSKDLPLRVSEWLHRAPRAGFSPPVTVVEGVDTIEVADIDFSLFGHGYYGEAEAVLYDMRELLSDAMDPSSRLRLTEAVTSEGQRYWQFTR
jgi:esterase/lipase superfamily enzyme